MKSPSLILFSSKYALEPIRAETMAHPHLETGGLLVGCRIAYKNSPVLVVLHASGPGEQADRQPWQYTPDSDALQGYLETWRAKFERYGADYIGEWHKHPPDLAQPSEGDIRQARAILDDPAYHLPAGDLLLPITRLVNRRFQINVFYMTRQIRQPKQLKYEAVQHTILLQLLDEWHHDRPTPTTVAQAGVSKPASTWSRTGRVSEPTRLKNEQSQRKAHQVGPVPEVMSTPPQAKNESPTIGLVQPDDQIRYQTRPVDFVETHFEVIADKNETSPKSEQTARSSQSPSISPVHSGVPGSHLRMGRTWQHLESMKQQYGFHLKVQPTRLAPEMLEITFHRPLHVSPALRRGKVGKKIAISLRQDVVEVDTIQVQIDAKWYDIQADQIDFEPIDQVIEALIKWLGQKSKPPALLTLLSPSRWPRSGLDLTKQVIGNLSELLTIMETHVDDRRQGNIPGAFRFTDPNPDAAQPQTRETEPQVNNKEFE
ncbi:MAG: Mov34/MPN/PAD-1 family protein [Anaerolineae bacterium]|nr:Mov34/MPN/PAD-1 family protein [Anaerolineae bacterium]